MRFAAILLLLLVACGSSSPSQSETAQKLNGTWQMETGGDVVFDFDADRVLVNGMDGGVKLDRVEGKTVFLKGSQDVQVRLIGDNTAEWDGGGPEPIRLTR